MSTEQATRVRSHFPFDLAGRNGRAFALILVALSACAVPVAQASAAAHGSKSTGRSALQTALKIELKASDFARGTPLDPGTARTVLTHSQPARCTPVSSKPWLADVFSDAFGLDGPSSSPAYHYVYSNVVIMPNAAIAKASLSATKARGYAAKCYEPANDVDALMSFDQSGKCAAAFVLASATITPLSGVRIGGNFVAYRYVTELHCPTTGINYRYYIDLVNKAIGKVFIQGIFSGTGSPVSGVEEVHLMSVMYSRA